MRRVPVPPIQYAAVRRLSRLAQRRFVRPDVAAGVTCEDVDLGRFGLRIYRPDGGVAARAAMIWLHGGGLMIGHPSQDDRSCSRTAAALGVLVVSVDYRLAPAARFPAAIDDCFAAWNWLQDNASRFSVDPARVAIAGQSAGGGLAAALTHRVRDAGGPRPVAQLLYSPMLDDRTGVRGDVRQWVWNGHRTWLGWRAYLGRTPSGTPYAVPARRADLSGLPPAWIGVGDIDVFLAEDLVYARRLREAGVEVTLDLVPAAPHGFENWAQSSAVATAYLDRSRAWLGAVLSRG